MIRCVGGAAAWTQALASPGLLLLADVAITCAFLAFGSYTEVDWVAYMQEVQGYIGGELDYTKLKGNTGPLVYPAGFVYFYGALNFLTSDGTNVALAQALFAALYLAVTAVVLHLYSLAGKRRSGRRRADARDGDGDGDHDGGNHIPFVLMATLIFSRRIHSLFMLRMFNDCVAMALLYAAVFLMTQRMWARGCFVYSLAVSVKMNIFLFAPGVLFVLLKSMPLTQVVVHLLCCCAVPQVVIGAPFFAHSWRSYISKAFELSRVFTYKWTVNFKFLPEGIFVAPWFGTLLLGLTMASWLFLCARRWSRRDFGQPTAVVQTIFESNMVGIVFSRTFHYQFYVWFFHQVPLLLALSCRCLRLPAKLALIAAIELGFSIYPSTAWSSLVLQGALLTVWAAMMSSSDYSARPKRD